MSEPRTSYVSYRSLQTQRLVLAALVLGLIAVILGVLFEVYYRGARSTQISPAIRRLAEPLNPVLNTEILSQVDGYELLSLEQIQEQFAGQPPTQILSRAQPQATASAQQDLVQQSVQQNTLEDEEVLTDEELNSLLEDDLATPPPQTTTEEELP